MLNEDKEKEGKEEEEEEEVEEQPLWVDEEDPTWPEEGEDGWGFRTSQFFDKMSLKTETKKTGDGNGDDDYDDDDDNDELVTNWESEADDWVIKEIVSNDWEANVFADPSPLLVYVFARYGRRFDLLSISLAFVGFMDLLSLRKMLKISSMLGMGVHFIGCFILVS